MANISTMAQTSMDIFTAVMDYGPLTLYSANSKTRIPMGTIHRHFKQLIQERKIRVYQSKRKGRQKIEYGPTIYGIINAYRQNKKFAEKIENYFLIWIEHKEFKKDLESEGFDVSLENLKKSKHVFRKFMVYFGAVEEQIDSIRRGDDSVSHDMQIFFSSMILSSNPQYQKLWVELYCELSGMQKSLDLHMQTMINSYKEFKRNFKK